MCVGVCCPLQFHSHSDPPAWFVLLLSLRTFAACLFAASMPAAAAAAASSSNCAEMARGASTSAAREWVAPNVAITAAIRPRVVGILQQLLARSGYFRLGLEKIIPSVDKMSSFAEVDCKVEDALPISLLQFDSVFHSELLQLRQRWRMGITELAESLAREGVAKLATPPPLQPNEKPKPAASPRTNNSPAALNPMQVSRMPRELSAHVVSAASSSASAAAVASSSSASTLSGALKPNEGTAAAKTAPALKPTEKPIACKSNCETSLCWCCAEQESRDIFLRIFHR